VKIEANDKTIQDIFSMGYFKIPRFQRPYSRGDDEVASFWNDVAENKDDSYFIGSMVTYQTKKPYYGIVDGQQRLTTITVILAAIRNAFFKLGENNLAIGIHYYIERPNVDNTDEFIINAETSFPYLQDHIQRREGPSMICDVGAEEQNLKSAFEFVTRKLEALFPALSPTQSVQGRLFDDPIDHTINTINKLKEIRDKVLSLKLVFIQLDNEDDAYLIFETLNARGRDLTTPDLVKNLLLNKIKSHHVQYDAAKVSWNTMVKKFDDAANSNGMEPFLYHYWLSAFEYTTDKVLFSKIKHHAMDQITAETSSAKGLGGFHVDVAVRAIVVIQHTSCARYGLFNGEYPLGAAIKSEPL